MNFYEYTATVLEEIESCLANIDQESINDFVDSISASKRIFCDGNGRSGLQIASFAMRLKQMGMESYNVDGVTTPAVIKDDLLIICSGSGETSVLFGHAKTARSVGAKVLLITTNRDSSIGNLADCVVQISAPVKSGSRNGSIQPMGTLFEQSSDLFFDVLVLILMEKLSITNTDMYSRHKNLE